MGKKSDSGEMRNLQAEFDAAAIKSAAKALVEADKQSIKEHKKHKKHKDKTSAKAAAQQVPEVAAAVAVAAPAAGPAKSGKKSPAPKEIPESQATGGVNKKDIKATKAPHSQSAAVAPIPAPPEKVGGASQASNKGKLLAGKSSTDAEAGNEETGAPRQHKAKRRRKGPAPAELVVLDPQEKARREQQRKTRELALKLRAEGKAYRSRRNKKSLTKKEGGEYGRLEPGETGSRPRSKVQVIIVPIFWNKAAEEKQEVVQAAKAVERLLSGAGVASGTDTTNALMPGQKFRFWEEKGVKVRVEIGPKEAAADKAILALCSTPGEVAAKRTWKVGPSLVAAVRGALGLEQVPALGGEGEPGTAAGVADKRSVPVEDAREADTEEGNTEEGPGGVPLVLAPEVLGHAVKKKRKEDTPKAAAASGAKESKKAKRGGEGEAGAAGPEGQGGGLEGAVPARVNGASARAADGTAQGTGQRDRGQKAAALLGSGDDLGDDFGLDLLLEEEEGDGKGRKKKKKNLSSRGGDVSVGKESTGMKAAKVGKVVKF